MAGSLVGDVSHQGTHQGGFQRYSQEKPADGSGWYFTRKELEENSPSKPDGIDWKKETYLRKSYCTFLQDLGMRLKVPQVTIATAIIFCHRFFLRQSHAKNDRRTIATVCMFLAGKVGESPRPLKDVILVSYEIIHKKDPSAVQRIKQKDVYNQQKELVLLGERVVLATLGFDLIVHNPYTPLVEAIKKFKVAQNTLAQVAWNFINDGLRTSLCLQFKPHHIAAGAIFLAAKFLKVKLPSDGEKVWWLEFDVTPRQLEEVSNQMLELYEQHRLPPSIDVQGTAGGGTSNRRAGKPRASNDETATTNINSQMGATSSKLETSKPDSSKTAFDSSVASHVVHPSSNHGRGSDYGSTEMEHKVEDDAKGNQHPERESLPYKDNVHEAQGTVRSQSDNGEKGRASNGSRTEIKEPTESKDKHGSRNADHMDCTFGQPPQEAVKKIDRDKVKAALEKRRKAAGNITKTPDVIDDDDLYERALEDGMELAPQGEKNKQDRSQSLSMSSEISDSENMHGRHQDHAADEQHHGLKQDVDLNAVEGEVEVIPKQGCLKVT